MSVTNRYSRICCRCLCHLLIFWLCGSGCHHQNHFPPADNGVTFWEVRKGNVISVMYEMHNVSEATVTISGNLRNMNSSVPLPCTVPISQRQGIVVIFTPKDSWRLWHYSWRYNWKVGQHAWIKPGHYLYSLPFQGKFPVIQGPLGTYSHGPGSQDEEAFDFGMPVGTPICAARDGVVIAFRSDMNGGGTDLRWQNKSNYIVIKHDDGTYAEYQHLRRNGVLVGLGETVTRGQVIGFSGATGHVSGPHLHFDVFHTLNGFTRETLPITFRADPHQ